MPRSAVPVLLALLTLAPAPADAQERATVADEIRVLVEGLRWDSTPAVGRVPIQEGALVAEFYHARSWQPAWREPGRVAGLLDAIHHATDNGLRPADYLLTPLDSLALRLGEPGAPAALRAEFDLLATEALARLATALREGAVDPRQLDSAWNFPPAEWPAQPAEVLEQIVASDSLAAAVAALAPSAPDYASLRAELARYRRLASGSWKPIPQGRELRPGARDARLPALRRRLAATGDLAPAKARSTSTRYDAATATAVRRYQRRLGLAADGVVGPRTLGELNLAPAARIATLRVNLERARWVLPGLPASYVAVNVPGYEARAVLEDTLRWEGRAVVGQPIKETPEFTAELTSIVLNPSWTVPPRILTEEILPEVRKDPGYLAAHAMRVLTSEGVVVNPDSVDWARYDGRTLPYRIVQAPGGSNPLGRVKFVLPNPYAVYLHDTPDRGDFARPTRALSHGCIRIERPVSLAEALVGDSAWTATALDSVLATGEERTITLPDPVPVLMLYWTAWVEADGIVNFRPDLYGRDAAVLAALNGKGASPDASGPVTPAPPRPGGPSPR